MKGTACSQCIGKQCPNFITTPWTSKTGEIEMVEDCAPKRTMLMIQSLHNTMIALQASHEEMRNKFAELEKEHQDTTVQRMHGLVKDLGKHLDVMQTEILGYESDDDEEDEDDSEDEDNVKT